jgi:transcriptional regulator with XRE-family HTH domain
MPPKWHHWHMDIRERIRSVIDASPEMTIRQVSLKAGLSDSMLHKFMTGQTDSLTIKTAEKLATALGVDPIWLVFGEGDQDEAGDISNLFRKIPDEDKPVAIRVLRGFMRA